MVDELEFEKDFWGDCANTFGEDLKHYVYAKYMGLHQNYFSFEANNKSILDIGGGPTSMLLKCINLKRGKVCDPLHYPSWTYERYKVKNIEYSIIAGEEIIEGGWDEVWIYNCLQHTYDPKEILRRAKIAASTIRIFEWIDIPAHEGHPQMITKDLIDSALGVNGTTSFVDENGCFGNAYYGYFSV